MSRNSRFFIIIISIICLLPYITNNLPTFYPDSFQTHSAVYQNNPPHPNFLIYAYFFGDNSSTNPTYYKHNIEYKRFTGTFTPNISPNIETEEFKEIFVKCVESFEFNLFYLYHTDYTYTLKLAIINTGLASKQITFDIGGELLTCNDIINPNNAITYVYLYIKLISKVEGKEYGTISFGCKNGINNKIYVNETTTGRLDVKYNIAINAAPPDLGICNYVLTVDVKNLQYFTIDGHPTCDSSDAFHKCGTGYKCVGDRCQQSWPDDDKKCSAITETTADINTDCKINYFDISKLQNMHLQSEPPRSNRVTLGFWLFMPKLDDVLVAPVNFVVENFFVLAIMKHSNTKVNAYCAVYEEKYRSSVANSETPTGLEKMNENDVIKILTPSLNNHIEDSVVGRWFYSQCGFSYEHAAYYLMTVMNNNRALETKNLQKEKLYDIGIPIYNDVYFKHFYYKDDKLNVYIRNAKAFRNGGLYLRNLLLFSEYMPTDVNFFYYNLHNKVNNDVFPHLLISFPLNEMTNNFELEYKFKKTDTSTTGSDKILMKSYNKDPIPQNFKRLVLSEENHHYIQESGVKSSSSQTNPSNQSGVTTCISDNTGKCFACNLNDKKWLVYNGYTCETQCPDGVTSLPGNSVDRGYCNLDCNNNGLGGNCSSINAGMSNFVNYECDNDKRENEHFYYQCFTKEDTPEYYLYYSSLYKSASIDINFNDTSKFSKVYLSYIIELWYYPDFIHYMIEYNKSPGDNNRNYVFYCNSAWLYIDKYHNKYDAEMVDGIFEVVSSKDNNFKYIHRYEWNKIVFNIKYHEGNVTTVEFFTNNNPYEPVQLGSTTGPIPLTNIYFCHKDPDCRDTRNEPLHWASGFYKNLRVWDGDQTQPSSTLNYDYLYPNIYSRVQGIILFLPLSTDFITGNKLKDPVRKRNETTSQNNIVTSFHIKGPLAETGFNDAWELPTFNYCGAFDVTKGRFQYVMSANGNQLVLGNCGENCARCWDMDKCYECVKGYYLFEHHCFPEARSNSPRYYSSPPVGLVSTSTGGTGVDPNDPNAPADDDEEIDYTDTILNEFTDFNRGTITFWVKPFGFLSTGTVTLIKYSEELTLDFSSENLTSDTYGLTLVHKVNNDILTQAEDFRDTVGQWTFIALSYWTYTGEHYPPLMKFQINTNSYPIDKTKIVKNIPINKFTITRNYFGLFAYLKLYTSYIIGALGYELNTSPTSPQLFQKNATLFSVGTSLTNCLSKGALADDNITFSCVIDEDERFSNIITTNPFAYLYLDNGVAKTEGCSTTCRDRCYLKESILLTNDNPSKHCSCRNINNNSQMIMYTSDKNTYCKQYDYFNFANTEAFAINNIKHAKATQKYTLQFWTWISRYVDTTPIEFTITWKSHASITITHQSIECYPIIKQDPLTKSTHDITFNKWNYISCSADLPLSKYYSFTETTEKSGSITSSTTIPEDTESFTLSFNDGKSTIEWGVMFIRQIRLWGRDFPSRNFLYRTNVQTPSLFAYLFNVFDPFYTPDLPYVITDLSNSNTNATVIRNELNGINTINEDDYIKLKLCGENGEIYQSNPEKCITFLDMNAMNTFTFNNIVPSFTGSYSLAFWIFVENINEFTNAIEFIFEEHMKINIEVTNAQLNAICHPQLYLNDINLNKKQVTLSSTSGEWLWVLCAVSNYDMKYELNGIEQKIIPEYVYDTQSNDNPYRYYFTNGARKTFTVYKKVKNQSKVYLRSLYLFNDFIPYSYDIKYVDMVNAKMFQLLLYVNFEDVVADYEHSKASLGYTVYEDNNAFYYYSTLTYDENTLFDLSVNFDLQTICELNETYSANDKKCVSATCDSGHSCFKSNSPLTCTSTTNPFLIVNSGTTTCKSECTNNMHSLPSAVYDDDNYVGALCNSKCDMNILNECPVSNHNNFKCKDSYIQLGYKCINKLDNDNSAFYYSHCYNMPNLHADFSDSTIIKCSYDQDYIFELWFKIDNNNFSKCSTVKTSSIAIDKYYYIFTMPHRIYYDLNTKAFYYEVPGQSTSLHIYQTEWNRILIKTYVNSNTVEIYVNYKLEIAKGKLIIPSSTSLSFNSIEFCTFPEFGACAAFGANVNWGSAYYKNIRIWDSASATVASISSFGDGMYNEYVQSLKHFWPFDISTFDKNKFINKIEDKCSLDGNVGEISTSEYYLRNKMFIYNYSTKFDWGNVNPNKYIALIKDGFVNGLPCHANCKRCYGQAYTECYECMDDYALRDTSCLAVTYYYMKLPLVDTSNDDKVIDIDLGVYNPDTTASQRQVFTLTMYLKFFGIVQGATESPTSICTFTDHTGSEVMKIYYDTVSEQKPFLHVKDMKQQGITMYKLDVFNEHVGKWVAISIATYSNPVNELYEIVYPSMFTFSLNRQDIPFDSNYAFPPKGVFFSRIKFSNEITALVGDIKVYSNFIHGIYGVITADINTSFKNLLNNIYLYSTSSTGCVDLNVLKQPATPITENDILCVGDYNPYHDMNNKCNNTKMYYDNDEGTCFPCDNSCISLCYGGSVKECTCDMTEGYYWLKKDSQSKRSYCEKIPYIDFSYLDRILIPNVPGTLTNENTLEFWIYISGYINDKNFTGLTVEWNKHNKIEVLGVETENKANVNCYAHTDFENINSYNDVINNAINYKKWVYLQCGTDGNNKEYFLNINENNLKTSTYRDTPNPDPHTRTNVQFAIHSPTNVRNSFGFVFLRQIKLWQQYNKKYILSGTVYISTIGSFPGLVALYNTEYDFKLELKNQITSTYTEFARKNDFIGYNYVTFDESIPYLCTERRVIDSSGSSCIEQTSIQTCGIVSTKGCVTCESSGMYLKPSVSDPKLDDLCVRDCGEFFYQENNIFQCRPCDESCRKCTFNLNGNCTACAELYYYIPSENRCVLNCEEEGLVSTINALTGFNECGPFEIRAALVNVEENVSIDRRYFTEIQAKLIGETTTTIYTEWGFDLAKTRKINEEHKETCEFDQNAELNVTHIYSETDLSKLTIAVNNTNLRDGCYYVVTMKLTLQKGGKDVSVTQPFTLRMNGKPYGGKVIISPTVGLFNTTYFIFGCSGWSDDGVEPLQYYITYREEGQNEMLPDNFEDWTYEEEIFSKIIVNTENIMQRRSVIVTVKCVAKDGLGLTAFTETNVTVYAGLGDGYKLSSALDSYSIPLIANEKHLYARSFLLLSLAIEPYNPKAPAFKVSYFQPNKTNHTIMLTDPPCTDDYCNSFGRCSFIDTYTTCYCDSTRFIGKTCQVEVSGYSNLKRAYEELLNLLIANITTFSIASDMALTSIHNVFEGATLFFQDDNFFINNIENVMNLIQRVNPSSLILNFKFYMELYNYYYEYVVHHIMENKIKIKTEKSLTNRTIALPTSLISNYKTQIDLIITNIELLMYNVINQLKTNKKQIEFESDYLYLVLTQISSAFNEDEFFAKRKAKYKPYIRFIKCINNHQININNNPFYQNWFAYFEFSSYPFMYDVNEYYNNTSPYILFFFADAKSGKGLYINECYDDNEIKIFFPFTSYIYLDHFNKQMHLYEPSNYKGDNNEVYNDPYYINASGYITRDTQEERIKIYHRQFNISCRYFQDKNLKWAQSGLTFKNFTLYDDYYVVCNSSHTTKFTTFFIENNITYGNNSRYYYLLRPRLFKWNENYYGNGGFWFYILMYAFYIGMVVLFGILDIKYFRMKGLLEFLKREIVKCHFQYTTKTENELLEVIPGIDVDDRNGELKRLFKHRQTVNDESDRTVDIGGKSDGFTKISVDYKENNNNKKNTNIQLDNVSDIIDNNDNEINPELFTIKTKNEKDVSYKQKKSSNVFVNYASPNPPPKQKGNAFDKQNIKSYFNYSGSSFYSSNTNNNNLLPLNNNNVNNNNELSVSEDNPNPNVKTYLTNIKPTFITHDEEQERKRKQEQKEIQHIQKQLEDKNKLLNEEEKAEATRLKQAYLELQVSATSFFCTNLKERHKLLSVFFKIAVFHPRWKKLTLFITECSIIMLINALFLTSSASLNIKTNIKGLIIVDIINVSITVLVMYVFPYFFLVHPKKREELFQNVIKGGQLVVLKMWEQMACKIRGVAIAGVIVMAIVWGCSFYVCIGFTAVWKEQLVTWVVCNVSCYILVYVVCEILIEGVIAVFFSLRKKGLVILEIGLWLNQMRNYRALWP